MRRCVREAAARAPRRSACRAPALIHPLRLQLEEDNREVLRLLRDTNVPEKLEGLKRLIAQSARPAAQRLSQPLPSAALNTRLAVAHPPRVRVQ